MKFAAIKGEPSKVLTRGPLTVKVWNRTKFKTAPLAKIALAAIQAEAHKPTGTWRVGFDSSRTYASRFGHVNGWARLGVRLFQIMLPTRNPDQSERQILTNQTLDQIARVAVHEIAHCNGVVHRQMTRDLRQCVRFPIKWFHRLGIDEIARTEPRRILSRLTTRKEATMATATASKNENAFAKAKSKVTSARKKRGEKTLEEAQAELSAKKEADAKAKAERKSKTTGKAMDRTAPKCRVKDGRIKVLIGTKAMAVLSTVKKHRAGWAALNKAMVPFTQGRGSGMRVDADANQLTLLVATAKDAEEAAESKSAKRAANDLVVWYTALRDKVKAAPAEETVERTITVARKDETGKVVEKAETVSRSKAKAKPKAKADAKPKTKAKRAPKPKAK